MSNNLFVDIETLGTSSHAVVLSLGMMIVDVSSDFTYQDLMDHSFFVKFDVEEQKALGREMEQRTIDWWKKQEKEVFDAQVRKKPYDESVYNGLVKAARWLDDDEDYNRGSGTVWTRGAIDSMVLEDLSKHMDLGPLFPYYLVRDVRTAVDILYDSSNGYVKFDAEIPSDAKKHNPVHDCALNALMLRYGIL